MFAFNHFNFNVKNMEESLKFYDEAQDCYCILQTGETAIYANIILQKGVIK